MSEGTHGPDEPDLEDTVPRPAPGLRAGGGPSHVGRSGTADESGARAPWDHPADETAADETEVDEDTLDRRPGAQAPTPTDDDLPDEDTILRPSAAQAAFSGSPLAPDVEDTVLRRPGNVEDTVARRPSELDHTDACEPANGSAPAGDDFIAQVPLARTIVPDDAPIQRFDRRPRFEEDQQSSAPAVLPASDPWASAPSVSSAQPEGRRSGSSPAGTPSSASPHSAAPAALSGASPASAGLSATLARGASPSAGSPSASSATPRRAGTPTASSSAGTPAGTPAAPARATTTGGTGSSGTGSGGPGSPSAPPGIDATRSPRRRGLLVPAIAFGCALLLLLGVGGGLATVWLNGRDSDPEPVATASSSAEQSDADPATEPGVWQPLGDDQVPGGDADQLQQVLADNPLVSAQLPQVDQCALPESAGGAVPEAELQGYLEAGAACLEEMWAGALDPQGIDFEGPAIVVYTVDALPEAAACDPVRFSEASPVVCHDDNTLYWPAAWDPGFSNASAEEASQLYMWHLSYSYSIFALASADLDGYFGALLIALADDPTRAEEAQRRYALQVSCLSSAAAFGMPDGVRPGGRVAGFVTSVEAQAAPATAGEPSPATRAAWVAAGRDGGGSLEACSTWDAAAEAVV